MKALQLVPAMEEGGVERYIVALNRILASAGWQNVVVSRGGKLEHEITAHGGAAVHFDLKSKNPLTVPLRVLGLRHLLKRERPDVVCAHSRVPAWLLALASHGLDLHWITYAHGANSISRYSRIMTSGARIMCPSTFIRDYLVNAYGINDSRFRVVPHGVDATRFDPAHIDAKQAAAFRHAWKIESDTRVVMSVGRLTRLKGFDLIIRAIAKLASSRTEPGGTVKLVIVGGAEHGKESYRDELIHLTQALDIEARVIFAGAQSDIPACLSLANVVVSGNTQKPESFGLSMAEALMMNKPVVAKAFGGALDIVRDGYDGILIKDTSTDDVTAFAAAIGHALTQSYGDIRASARTRFDFDIMSKKTLAVYEELTT